MVNFMTLVIRLGGRIESPTCVTDYYQSTGPFSD
jgi:hypothetical protein